MATLFRRLWIALRLGYRAGIPLVVALLLHGNVHAYGLVTATGSTTGPKPAGWDDGRIPARFDSPEEAVDSYISYFNSARPTGSWALTYSTTNCQPGGANCAGNWNYQRTGACTRSSYSATCPIKGVGTTTSGSGKPTDLSITGSATAKCKSGDTALTLLSGAPTCTGTVSTCPAGASATAAGNCECGPGYRGGDMGGAGAASSCTPYSCSAKSNGNWSSDTDFGTARTYSCDSTGARAGCTIEFQPVTTTTDDSGHKQMIGVQAYNGQTCEGKGTNATTDPAAKDVADNPTPTNAEKCALGNGAPMCAGAGGVCVVCNQSTSTQDTTTTTPSGAGSAPSGISAGTKTTTTSCSGATCTTTTTTKDTSGATTSTTTTTGVANPALGSGLGGGGTGTDTCALHPNATGCVDLGNGVAQPSLYTAKSRTYTEVLTDFKNTVNASPIGSATSGFFTISLGSGACPTWSLDIPYFGSTATIDFMCSSAFTSLLAVFSVVLQIVAAYAAFRIAFL